MAECFGPPIEIHSDGILMLPFLEGAPNSGERVNKGAALSLLSCSIHLYENLRVRDIFKMLIEYPELIELVPYLDRVVEVYKNYPKIGCSSPEVSTVWLCRSTMYASDEDGTLSESIAFIAAEDAAGKMGELYTFDKDLGSWLDCPIKKGLDSLLLNISENIRGSFVFETQFSLFELLVSIPETFTYESGIRD